MIVREVQVIGTTREESSFGGVVQLLFLPFQQTAEHSDDDDGDDDVWQ
jgi:hypothetical protein